MQNDHSSSASASESASNSDTPSGLSSEALARRRVLLKGLSKGGVVVAAAVPLHSLAAGLPPDGTLRLCTVSGIQSNVGSGRTGGTTQQCQGNNPQHFTSLANWPGYSAGSPPSIPPSASFIVGTQTITNLSAFSSVFGGGSGTGLFDILVGSGNSEKIWITALLNAVKRAATLLPNLGYFPYSASEVIALYSSTNKADAEFFFSNYLQTVP